MRNEGRRAYRAVSLGLALVFVAVGALFLFVPAGIEAAFARLAPALGMGSGPIGTGLFRILAVAYMSVVAVLAWLMFRRPAEPAFPLLLAQAKLASAGLSAALFLIESPGLLLLANGIADGTIGVFALIAGLSLRRAARRRST